MKAIRLHRASLLVCNTPSSFNYFIFTLHLISNEIQQNEIWIQLSFTTISFVYNIAAINSVAAEETHGQSNLVLITQIKENRSHQNLSTSALDLLAQQNEITSDCG